MSEVTDIEEDISEMGEEQGIEGKISLINSCMIWVRWQI